MTPLETSLASAVMVGITAIPIAGVTSAANTNDHSRRRPSSRQLTGARSQRYTVVSIRDVA